ncbi:TraB/GumN family protein [Cohnella panacarvi]|uniref:TraB/GumN family protein n=1 Tax=Cohnella panacarvi TaxID=400776 RepID=UPI00047AE63D|nr:TraB/GumN family protein [Cohnella panacarvi]
MRQRSITGIAGLLLLALLAACGSSSNDDSQPGEGAEPVSSTVIASAEAESPSVPAAEGEPQKPGSKGFLWRVTGGENSGYLVGTIHVARKGMYPLDEDLKRAVADSDYIGLELDLTTVDQLAMAKLVAEKALLADGTELKDHVSEEDYEKFKQLMKKSLGIVGASAFDKYEPWYGAMTLEALPATKYKEADGIDLHLAKEAHENGKTIIELESVDSQLGIFDGFTDELQENYFHQTVKGAGLASIGMKQMLDMWTIGDVRILEKMHDSYLEEGSKTMGDLFDEFDREFLVNRNIGMVEKIDRYLSEGEAGTYLFAVGSLHMVGEHGLVEELEHRGYQVEFID